MLPPHVRNPDPSIPSWNVGTVSHNLHSGSCDLKREFINYDKALKWGHVMDKNVAEIKLISHGWDLTIHLKATDLLRTMSHYRPILHQIQYLGVPCSSRNSVWCYTILLLHLPYKAILPQQFSSTAIRTFRADSECGSCLRKPPQPQSGWMYLQVWQAKIQQAIKHEGHNGSRSEQTHR